MPRRPVLIVSGTLVAAFAGLLVFGLRVLERDRDALFKRYGDERARALADAARGVFADIVDIGEDLAIAATLVRDATTSDLAIRELHAIATIKREYLVMYARADDGAVTKATTTGAPDDLARRADPVLEELLTLATAQPATTHASRAFAADGDAAWYRVYARRRQAHGPAIGVVVDTSVLLRRMKLQPDPLTRVVVLDADGTPAPASAPELARLVREQPDLFASLATHDANAPRRSLVLPGALAMRAGLPDTDAVATAVPLAIDAGPPWLLLAVASTQALQAQQRTIVRRVIAGGALVLVLLLSAAAYVLHNTFRARALREKLEHAEHLAHLTEKAEKILENIPSGVLTVSEEQRVTGVNRWLADRIGHNVVGRTLDTAFPKGRDEDRALVFGLVETALKTREPQLLHRDRITLLGSEASLNIHAVPLARGVGDVSLLLVFEDLTELRRIEQQLLHSEKLVTAGQLAAGIAHEIGTPLNVARGRVELSLAHLGVQHPDAENQRIVIDQIDRVTRLIQQLLDYVRTTPASAQAVDLAHVLQVVNGLLAPQAAKRQVSLRVDVDGGAPTVQADADQVQQIVVNLVLNAIDACDRGGAVVLRARSTAEAICVEIVDDGHGIPREIHKQVFDPFFTTKKRGQGTGLGLWVVAQLVRAHAAEISLDSEPGRGTTVRVAWPVRA